MESQHKEGISNKEEEDVAVSEDELNIGRKNKVEEIGLIKIKEGKSLLTAISDISVIMPTSLAGHSGEASSEEKPEDQLIHTGLKEETHMTEIPSTSATSGEDMGGEIKDGKSLLTDCDKVTEADNRSKQMDLESEESSLPELNKCDSEVTESCKESMCHMETSSSVFSSPRVSHLLQKRKQKKKTKIAEMSDTVGDSPIMHKRKQKFIKLEASDGETSQGNTNQQTFEQTSESSSQRSSSASSLKSPKVRRSERIKIKNDKLRTSFSPQFKARGRMQNIVHTGR